MKQEIEMFLKYYIYMYVCNKYKQKIQTKKQKQKNVFLVTLKILHIVVTTALKKIYIYIYNDIHINMIYI